MLSETQDSINTSKQSAKPPLKPSSSKAQLPSSEATKSEEVERESESSANVNEEEQEKEEQQLEQRDDDEEIESRYSDGKD